MYRNEIMMYMKGADTGKSKRLSKKTLENENYDVKDVMYNNNIAFYKNFKSYKEEPIISKKFVFF